MRHSWILMLLLLGVAPSAWGWNETGHMLIGSLAYDRLTPGARAQLVELIRQHPRFEQDFKSQIPRELQGEEVERWLFMRAGVWPDLARSLPREQQQRYHRSSWHYVNVPIYLDPKQAGTFGEDRQEASEDPARVAEGRLNVLQALTRNLQDLTKATASPAEKAVALCWVLHLIGDLHQPCHAGTLYSTRFPKGDAGGNAVAIDEPDPYAGEREGGGRGRNSRLHLFWDGLLGENDAPLVLGLLAHDLKTDPALRVEQLPELRAGTTAKAWVMESYAFARDAVYDERVRAAIRLQEVSPREPFVPVRLSAAYRETARLVARRRAVLAAERLAGQLNAAAGK